jgi:hypothetical protein
MTPLNRRFVLLGSLAAPLAVGLPSIGRAMGPTTFSVTIRNVANGATLKLPDGRTANAPIAPGVYAVGKAGNVLFTPGGMADEAIERLAEDGNFQPMLDKVTALRGLAASGMFLPGQPFTFTASPGDRLQFATMFVQSNDLFFAPKAGGIALFDSGGRAIHGNVTSQVALYDAGTEVNQAPGAGADQAPRQAKPNTGKIERVAIDLVANRHDGFSYPAVETVIEVEIVPISASRPQG